VPQYCKIGGGYYYYYFIQKGGLYGGGTCSSKYGKERYTASDHITLKTLLVRGETQRNLYQAGYHVILECGNLANHMFEV